MKKLIILVIAVVFVCLAMEIRQAVVKTKDLIIANRIAVMQVME